MYSLIRLVCVIFFTLLIVTPLYSQRYVIKEWEYKHSFSTGFPAWGVFGHTDFFDINTVKGFNLCVGYSEKNFYEPMHPDSLNPYFQWGTVAFIIPYVGWGIEYLWGGGFYVGVGTFFIIPYPYLGVYLSEIDLLEDTVLE